MQTFMLSGFFLGIELSAQQQKQMQEEWTMSLLPRVSEFEGIGKATYTNLIPCCGIAVSFRCSINLSYMDKEGNSIFLF